MALADIIRRFRPARAVEQDTCDDRVERLYARALEGQWDGIQDLLDEERGWKRISSLTGQPTLDPAEHSLMLRLAMHFMANSPLAVRIVRTMAAHICGSVLQFTTHSEELTREIQAFWQDPVSGLERDFIRMCREWLAFGELFLPAFPAKQTGRLRIGYLHPSQISAVQTDPDNARIFISATEQRTEGDRTWTILNSPPVMEHLWSGRTLEEYDPDALWLFYFPLQHGMLGRGRSVLETMFYWIHRAEQFLNDRMMLNNLLKAFIWQVRIQGGEAEVQRRALEIGSNPPRPGSVKVVNESESWEAVVPSIHANDTQSDYLAVLKYVATGAGFPEHWVGASQDVNRSTAASSSEPSIRDLEVLQTQWLDGVIRPMLQVQAMLLINSGYLRAPMEAVDSIDLLPPDLSASDNAVMAEATLRMVQAVQLATASELMTRQTARLLVHNAAGVPMPDNIDDLIAEERQRDAAAVYGTGRPPSPAGENTP